jgi:hypothetical protein
MLRDILEALRTWIELIVLITQKQAVLDTYLQPEVSQSPPISQRPFIETANLFWHFIEAILVFPELLRPLFAREIVSAIFEAMKRQELTPAFIAYFNWPRPDFAPTQYLQSLLLHILKQMLEFAASNSHLISSSSIEKASFILSWVVFTSFWIGDHPCPEKSPLLGLSENISAPFYQCHFL